MPVASGYSKTQIRLHWITVGLVLLQYVFHDGIADAFEAGLDTGTMTMSLPVALHMGGGMFILGIVLYRLFLRSSHGAPPPPEAEPGWARLAARGAHWGFYAVLILLPVTGAVAWAQASQAAGDAHELLRALLLLLILAHIVAVLIHQFVWKTGLMDRMRRPSS
ncbi:MAG: cytochrome b/b6 domain-containing protein [Paracoccaceae bacterium]|nr:cytochrome b/b6 domain-containing protein [Paracoccaceae bacterium]